MKDGTRQNIFLAKVMETLRSAGVTNYLQGKILNIH
jgi:hypothetical protein